MMQVWKDKGLYRVQYGLSRYNTETGQCDSVVTAGMVDLASVLARSRSASGMGPCRIDYWRGLFALQLSL